MPPIIRTQPSASLAVSISPSSTHPANTANTLSSDMSSDATVGIGVLLCDDLQRISHRAAEHARVEQRHSAFEQWFPHQGVL